MSNEESETQYNELSPVRPISYKASGGKRKARKASKKSSKRTSKKVTRKPSKKTSSKKGRKMARPSKKGSKKVSRKGSKKVSRKGSKKASRKGSKKGSKKRSMKRNNPLNSPGVVAWKALLDKVSKKVGFGGPIAMGIAKHYKEKAASQLGDTDTIKTCKKAQELFDKESSEDIKKVTEKVKVESAKKRAAKKSAKKEKMAKRATNYSETSN